MIAAGIVLVTAFAFACAGLLGMQLGAALCAERSPFEDGPPKRSVPALALVGGAAAIGAALALRGAPLMQVALGCVLVAALAGSWYSDARVGAIPDQFTLLPLALVLVLAAYLRDVSPYVSALAIAVPFALVAWASKGRGLGWGDVKLVALGGATLGAQYAFFAFMLACAGAAGVAWFKSRTGVPVAFAPYLAGAMGAALPFSFTP